MITKITRGARWTEIEPRIHGIDYAAQGIRIMSCTMPQTFIARNFNITGDQIGGMAITELAKKQMITLALEQGLRIEEVE